MTRGAVCERCRDEVWADPLPLAWLGRHAHGTHTVAYFRRWTTTSSAEPVRAS